MSNQKKYSQLSAKQRKSLRDNCCKRLYLVTGIGEPYGNAAWLEFIKQEVISRDKDGVVIRVTGPNGYGEVSAQFKTGRAAPGAPLFLYLLTLQPTGPVLRSALGFDPVHDLDNPTMWDFELEAHALYNERVRKFLAASVATSKDCYLFEDGLVARIRNTDNDYFVEFIYLNGAKCVSVCSLDCFLGVHLGLK